ncbi:hypothetical protein SERLADRAFT_454280 [Serpula lacrymans var. lacrymans S7.9]|uniref:FAD/NAD(P)-binding domain-containing protein n=1 Tax=Serpula lacrymans var. lacrymans (strain S7.9) TaxID=578457 RepID=F8PE98_SERL9|nr:uncharacterized protein SERLADRAFT_454280 [Serpula lacrymans var. lacrymans S7.9]EGO18695.1 hypothetical protein SERLADRAFT_454280 [Serpula lacrymans var. lacrymans S7.9]
MDKGLENPRIVVVGAGIAGISVAVALRNELKFDNFTIYEKASSIGGTWRGCGSDVPGHWYSLSTELNPHWDSYYISQPEIRAYWERIFQKHGLLAHTVFNTHVKVVKWDAESRVHNLTLVDPTTGEETTTSAEIVIQAVGGFTAPLFPPDLPGVEKFRGPLWHSLKWRHDVDLAGKRVGVIGNGCSAAQFIPQISEDPSVEVINFCRTAQWMTPRQQYRYPAIIKWVFAHIPFLMRAYRNTIMAKLMTKYMKDTAPAKYHDRLIPSYSPGCKRIIVDPSYLSALHRPNVDLNWESIQEIAEDGVILKNGQAIPLDVIIFGTGFLIVPTDISVQGPNGHTLHDYFDSHGGPTAYLGTVYPGLPNYFTVVGPNTASGHASLLFADEVQIKYILQLIKPIIKGKMKTLEVKAEATDEYNNWIQKRMQNTVFTECFSYYRGDGRDGPKNIATFPGTMRVPVQMKLVGLLRR